MNIDTNRLDLCLQPRGIFSVPDAAGVRIACRDGSVWITLDNDPRDIVLEAGQSFVGSDHRRATIYALNASRLALTEGATLVAEQPALPVRRFEAQGRMRTPALAT